MSGQADKPTREVRLAAKLRENLRRRKAQGRAIESAERPLPKDGDAR
ncbi:hypothetical protein [Tsuneonella mangrovi]|nr:hypothetical protein [Tsuneonella mangrovi]